MHRDELSVTSPQNEGWLREGSAVGLLLLVGSAHEGAGPDVPRLLRLEGGLEIGRARPGGEGFEDRRLNLRDRLLSRTHVRIQRLPGGGYEVEDAGSLNGTFVGGHRITERRRLGDGALLMFGGHAAVFRRATPEAVAAIEEELAAPFGPVPTLSPELAATLWRLRRLARGTGELLLTGETGAGKEVYARAVHDASGRAGAFVAINCAAIPAELAESELFGYVRGAHSTARESKAGLVQTAQGGTLFLDEIGDMSPPLQAKLLRFLQDREVRPLGSTTGTRVDVQVIGATSGGEGVPGAGTLRADLAARLGAEAIRILPLRDRVEDIGTLLWHFLGPTAVREVEPAAFHSMLLYPWPRNVRELEKVLGEVVAVMEAGQTTLSLVQLPAVVRSVAGRATPVVAARTARGRARPSRAELIELLRAHDGNVSQVARILGRQWAVVWRWLVKHKIDPDDFRR